MEWCSCTRFYLPAQSSGMIAITTTESPTAPAIGSKPAHRQRTRPRRTKLPAMTQSSGTRVRVLDFSTVDPIRLIVFSRTRKLEITTAAQIVKEAPARGETIKAASTASAPNANARRLTRGITAAVSLAVWLISRSGSWSPARPRGQPDEVDERGDEAERRADPRRDEAQVKPLADPPAEEVARGRRQ